MRRAEALATTMVAMLLLVSCGGDGDPPEAQPVPNETTFGVGRFDELPRYPGSGPLGERHEQGDTTAQSFRADGATPEQVLAWYSERLQDWSVVEAPHQIGVGTFRGRWAKDDRALIVSATEAPALPEEGAGERPVVQYSLSFEPLASEPSR